MVICQFGGLGQWWPTFFCEKTHLDGISKIILTLHLLAITGLGELYKETSMLPRA